MKYFLLPPRPIIVVGGDLIGARAGRQVQGLPLCAALNQPQSHIPPQATLHRNPHFVALPEQRWQLGGHTNHYSSWNRLHIHQSTIAEDPTFGPSYLYIHWCAIQKTRSLTICASPFTGLLRKTQPLANNMQQSGVLLVKPSFYSAPFPFLLGFMGSTEASQGSNKLCLVYFLLLRAQAILVYAAPDFISIYRLTGIRTLVCSTTMTLLP